MYKKILISSLLALSPFSVGAVDLPAYPFIHVDGTGMIAIMPDMGEIDFEIAARDADPALAMNVVASRVEEVRALMKEAGVEDDSLEVRDMRKDISKADPMVVVYEIRAGVKVKVKDLSKWKAIVAPLLDKPNLDGFMTVFDSSERAKVEIALMGEAIRQARRKAEGIAAGFGRKVGAVTGVSSGELKNLTRAMNLSPADFNQRGDRRQTPPDRGDLLMVTMLKLAQPVDVIFRIK